MRLELRCYDFVMETPVPISPAQGVSPVGHHSHRRLIISLAIIIVLGLLLLFTSNLWLPRLVVGYTLHEIESKRDLSVVPIQHTLSPVTAAPAVYTINDVEFQTPWTDLATSSKGSLPSLRLHYGTTPYKVVAIFPSGFNNLHNGLISSPQDQAFFGYSLKTNYDVYEYIMHLTPADINLFGPYSDLLPKSILLVMKGVIGLNPQHEYDFENANGVRGIEDVMTATSTVVTFFTPKDQSYELLVTRATQQEVDTIVSSLREISSTTPIAQN